MGERTQPALINVRVFMEEEKFIPRVHQLLLSRLSLFCFTFSIGVVGELGLVRRLNHLGMMEGQWREMICAGCEDPSDCQTSDCLVLFLLCAKCTHYLCQDSVWHRHSDQVWTPRQDDQRIPIIRCMQHCCVSALYQCYPLTYTGSSAWRHSRW